MTSYKAKIIYIPTQKELAELQTLNGNVSAYLSAKMVEIYMTTIALNPDNNLKDPENYPRFNDPKLIYAIRRLNPERRDGFGFTHDADSDKKLLIDLINSKPDTSGCQLDEFLYKARNLDNLSNDPEVILAIIKKLNKILINNPLFRFNYLNDWGRGAHLLDDIFTCGLQQELITEEMIWGLIAIDPIYAVKLSPELKNPYKELFKRPYAPGRSRITKEVQKYCYRYGLDYSSVAEDLGDLDEYWTNTTAEDVEKGDGPRIKRLIKDTMNYRTAIIDQQRIG